MLRLILHVRKYMLIVVVCTSSCAIVGVLESNFVLSNESRLPRWFALPPGHTRSDVSVTLSYYSAIGAYDTKIMLKDMSGKTLEETIGKNKCQSSTSQYPAYVAIEADGTTEVIEHKRMEPVFYVNDDPSIRQKLLACKF